MSKRPKLLPLDRWLLKCGWADDRADARSKIANGEVLVDGLVVTNPATQVRPDRPVRLRSLERQWVGRGAIKLLGALADLPMDVAGHTCVDLGSSTGGFTEVLLDRGARRVFAVDVGRGLLHRTLEVHPNVTVMEGTNARTLQALPEPATRMVGDLSFISLHKMLPAVGRLLAPGGEALLLIKPQFEAPKHTIQAGGTVSDEDRQAAIDGVVAGIRAAGMTIRGEAASRLPGARSGNLEHFVWLQNPGMSSARAGERPAC